MRGHRGMLRAVWQLDLSKEQQDELQALSDEKRTEVRNAMRKLADGRKELREAAVAEPYDAARIEELAEAQGTMVTDMIVKRVEAKRQIRALLTPEQLAELDAARSERPCRNATN